MFDLQETHDREVLEALQLDILPYDELVDTFIGWWWIAYQKDIPVGFAGLYPEGAGDGYLIRVGVVPEYRGNSLMKRLTLVLLAKANELGMKWVYTDTTDNPPSANGLISCGFRMYTPERPWAYRHSCYWRKNVE